MSHRSGLIQLEEGVWTSSDPVSIVGMPLTTTMSVVRTGDGNLLVYSPVELTVERHAEILKLGTVGHIYAPNLFHHLHVAGWIDAFPQAKVHAPQGLQNKRPDLRVDRIRSGDVESGFSDVIDEIPIEGFRLQETALFHRPTGTLIVADLVHNVGRPQGAWTKTYTHLMGFYDRVALSRALRWTAFSDRRAARASVDALLALPTQRVIVGHGAPILVDVGRALSDAFRFLRNTA